MSSISQTPSIYQIRHIGSGRVYIGCAVNPRKRWYQHRTSLRAGNHHSSYLQRAWNKYGESAFVFEIVEPVLFVEDLLTREQYWMDHIRASGKHRLFNTYAVAGSPLGTKASDETRAKQSEARRGRSMRAAYEKRWIDPDARRRQSEHMSRLNTARYQDPVERAKAVDRLLAARNSPEAHARWVEKSRATKNAPDYRTKAMHDYIITDPDGVVYETWNLARFCREHGLNKSYMGAIARGTKRNYKGWRCRFAEAAP